MGDGGLRQVDALLDIAGAKPNFFSNRACALFLQNVQNAAASGIGNRMQHAVERGL